MCQHDEKVTKHGDKYFTMSSYEMTIMGAPTFCQSKLMEMATFDTAEELGHILDFLSEF